MAGGGLWWGCNDTSQNTTAFDHRRAQCVATLPCATLIHSCRLGRIPYARLEVKRAAPTAAAIQDAVRVGVKSKGLIAWCRVLVEENTHGQSCCRCSPALDALHTTTGCWRKKKNAEKNVSDRHTARSAAMAHPTKLRVGFFTLSLTGRKFILMLTCR